MKTENIMTAEHLQVLEQIKDGATIWGYREARLLREVQQHDAELLTIINIKNLEEITGQKFNGAERMPYFGAILTAKGSELISE